MNPLYFIITSNPSHLIYQVLIKYLKLSCLYHQNLSVNQNLIRDQPFDLMLQQQARVTYLPFRLIIHLVLGKILVEESVIIEQSNLGFNSHGLLENVILLLLIILNYAIILLMFLFQVVNLQQVKSQKKILSNQFIVNRFPLALVYCLFKLEHQLTLSLSFLKQVLDLVNFMFIDPYQNLQQTHCYHNKLFHLLLEP